MPEILNAANQVVQHSKNSRGIREYVGKHAIKKVSILKTHDGCNFLIIFNNGNYYLDHWTDFDSLFYSLRRWRNLRGVPLKINGNDCGRISKDMELPMEN